MTTIDCTTTVQAAPVLVIWEVKAGSKKPARVEVTPNGAAECKCDNFVLFGECEHIDAVQAERQRRGLKH